MDPNNNQGNNKPLDPNLQAAYDRVMGTDVSSPSPVPSVGQPAADTTNPASPMPAADTSNVTPSAPEPSMPPMPDLSSVLSDNATPAAPAAAESVKSTPPDMTNPVASPIEPTQPISEPTTPPAPAAEPMTTPSAPQLPTTPVPDLPTSPTPPESPAALPTPAAPADTLQATITMPQITHRETETVQIGGGPVGGVAAVKPKGKGVSPVILIFGAFAFLVVYAVFWVKFFNYSLPFLPK